MPIDFSPTLITASRCAVHEQLALFPLIQILVESVRNSNLQGTLCLEEFLVHIHSTYPTLHILLEMVVDGHELEVILEVGFHLLYRKKCSSVILKNLIILEGIDCILQRQTPWFTRKRLHALLDGDLVDPEKAVMAWERYRKTSA